MGLSCMLLGAVSATAQRAARIHDKAILIDGHNDVTSASVVQGRDITAPQPDRHTDLPRWKKGGLDVQFFSVFTGPVAHNPKGVYADANDQIDSLEALIRRHPEQLMLAKSSKEIRQGLKQKKLVALIGVEGGHMIENDLRKLEALQKRGMRYLTLTWNNSNSWATSALDETQHPDTLKHKGLTAFGKSVVRRLNELGVLVDLSHTGEQTFYDAIATSTKPIILSHSSVYQLCPVFRNVKDDQIRAVAKNGGVICINFYSGFISRKFDEKLTSLSEPVKKQFVDSVFRKTGDTILALKHWDSYFKKEMETVRPTLSDLVDHIDYIVKLVGDDYVGIGSDYDGIGSVPAGLEDVSAYPNITAELLKRGYTKKSIRKILGGNVLRVIGASF
ncbi:dipeptidase [Niabella drilacis]|uniref:Membrane dipeptidase n=1 Tax=Niabella drilacis (strain DSM 25811 / CCM 8410 / CCUG 62505 / LMG 26954 / E90) TaxID=1285928 RepID=A0A1G6JQ34_NIADE|nr:dipeptidase [Niabella drilacis]SDC20807.1 membrane dipeptidase [Niabella drilacis]